jgi:ADP-ribosyl-[dinitrogen reductase] hydrolase
MRSSITNPLGIAELSPAPGFGRIGLTFCPGKKQPASFTGSWDRDLAIDLDAARDWGATALVTLIEDHELKALQVEPIGSEARARNIDWFHLPIADVSVPCHRFERSWNLAGEQLRTRLRNGFDVLVHCKGGLGRAGMVSARLLVELGWTPSDAIAAVRAARPGAIETAQQVAHIAAQKPVEEPIPSQSPEAIEDRAVGALLGLAVGDAVGTTLEFRGRDTYPPLTDMVGGGPFRLARGQWTDDTAMALALADSLLAQHPLEPGDLMARFVSWWDEGSYSCTGRCFDIGNTVATALSRFKQTGKALAGSTDPYSAGNGSLMRLAPVALRYFNDRAALEAAAALQSRTTHGAAEAVEACVVFANLLADAIQGRPLSQVLRDRRTRGVLTLKSILLGSWRGKHRPQVHSSGYVVHSLEAAIWSVARTSDFHSAVLLAANLGGDADTTAAITGQLAGAIYGRSGIPQEWLDALAWRKRIEKIGAKLAIGAAPSCDD